MSINGVSASTLNGTKSASSDGVDDFAQSSANGAGAESLPQNATFGVAVTFNCPSPSDVTTFFGVQGPPDFRLADTDFFSSAGNGEATFVINDGNGNDINIGTDANVCDGQTHLLVINKVADTSNGYTTGDVEMFLDDMSTPTPTTEHRVNAFDHTQYNPTTNMTMFARDDLGTVKAFKSFTAGLFEFNTEPYSQQDRLDLLRRAPGL
jgi:hypothetical protein